MAAIPKAGSDEETFEEWIDFQAYDVAFEDMSRPFLETENDSYNSYNNNLDFSTFDLDFTGLEHLSGLDDVVFEQSQNVDQQETTGMFLNNSRIYD